MSQAVCYEITVAHVGGTCCVVKTACNSDLLMRDRNLPMRGRDLLMGDRDLLVCDRDLQP